MLHNKKIKLHKAMFVSIDVSVLKVILLMLSLTYSDQIEQDLPTHITFEFLFSSLASYCNQLCFRPNQFFKVKFGLTMDHFQNISFY
jgi:hypothetical protein